MRILLTGSQDWSDRLFINKTLNDICKEFDLNHEPDEYGNTMPDPNKITIVHGDCVSGADHWAGWWCVGNFFEAERHPADWSLGKGAGYKRNAEMVSLGADLCLVFSKVCTKRNCIYPDVHGSHGASHTQKLSEKAGIPTRVYKEGW